MIVNLTPHTLNIFAADEAGCDVLMSFPPSGTVARVATSRACTGAFGGIDLFETRFGEVTGLPDAIEGVILVVSGIVASHPSVRNRTDVFSPGELVRDGAGQPIGCRGLSRSA